MGRDRLCAALVAGSLRGGTALGGWQRPQELAELTGFCSCLFSMSQGVFAYGADAERCKKVLKRWLFSARTAC